MRSYEDLKLWQLAHGLCREIYTATEAFPKHETYGLRQQIRNAALSVPSNICEGCGRSTVAELLRFVDIAMGSVSEVHYQLRLSADLGYLTPEQHARLQNLAADVRKTGAGFQAYLRQQRVIGATKRPTVVARKVNRRSLTRSRDNPES